METIFEPNLLLEALAYLGARANGSTVDRLEQKLQNRGIAVSEEFDVACEPLRQLTALLNRQVDGPDSQLERLFRSLDGFPHSTVGSHSPVFLLLYPVLHLFRGDLDGLLQSVKAMSPEQIARNLLLSLDMEDLAGQTGGYQAILTDSVLSLDVPAESRLALLTVQRSYGAILDEAGQWLRPALEVLRQNEPLLARSAGQFRQQVQKLGCAAYLHETSSLDPKSSDRCRLHPLLLAPDTNLSLEPMNGDDRTDLYCGVLRLYLRQMLSSAEDDLNQVYDMIRLLGDKTRFSILCYLSGRSAYGIELAEHFNLARNTIHHHMNKLLNAELVTCTVSGSRVYYETNQEKLAYLLECQRRLLLSPQEP